jgi:hypothetical protein
VFQGARIKFLRDVKGCKKEYGTEKIKTTPYCKYNW